MPIKLGKQLKKAVEHSWDSLKFPREERNSLLRGLAGMHYSENAKRGRHGKPGKKLIYEPLPLMENFVRVFSWLMSAENPRAMVSSKIPQFRSFAELLGLRVNRCIDDMALNVTLNECVEDAMMVMGWALLCIADDVFDKAQESGRPIVKCMDFDDMVFDVMAAKVNECAFIGHRALVDLEQLKSSERTDPAVAKLLKPTTVTRTREGGEESTQALGNWKEEEEELIDKIEVYQLYFPESGMTRVYPVEGVWDAPIWEFPCYCPSEGPYHALRLGRMPKQIIPLSPTMTIRDLADFNNDIYRKLMTQAWRQKTNTGYESGFAEDAQRLRKAEDGQYINFDDLSKIARIESGGASQINIGMWQLSMKEFNDAAGNPDLLAGLSPASETATQDTMLNAAAGRKVQAMQAKVLDFAKGIVKALAWYEWTDQWRYDQLPFDNGAGTTFINWTPETRRGRFLDYNFEIAPYSMVPQSPATKIQGINNIFMTLSQLVPIQQMLMQMGTPVDMPELIKTLAKLHNVEDVISFTTLPPSAEESMVNMDMPQKSPVSTRNYVRTNRPGAIRSQQRQEMAGLMLDLKSQPAEQAQIFRSAG